MNAVVKVEQENTALAAASDAIETPSGVSPLVAMLASGQLKAEHISQAMELQKDHDEYEAKKAYSAALARFRKIAPTLRKNKRVDFQTKAGRTTYDHTSLGYALTEVNPLLGDCDLNLSWHPRQADGLVYVVTRLTHTLGHSDEIEMFSQPDNTGNKNPMQATSSAITYLKREGAFSILGLASEHDDDGHAAHKPAPPTIEYIDESDMADITAVITELGRNPKLWTDYWVKKNGAGVGGIPLIAKADKARSIKNIRENAEKQAEAEKKNEAAEKPE